MKKLIGCILALLFLSAYTGALGETIVTYGGAFPDTNTGYQNFLADHPDITVTWSDTVYPSASAFLSAMLTREFACDLFVQGTNEANWSDMMQKGYCLDLSGSDVLQAAVKRMHPYIAAQARYEGRLYAIPMRINFMYYQINQETWSDAGLTVDDVPQSFPEFLDFLSQWCEHMEDGTEADIGVLGGWDYETYSASSYTAWLSNLLIDEVMMQEQYAGETLSFNSPELIDLLERCASVGKRIYALEPRNCTSCLFEQTSYGVWPESGSNIVFLRLNQTQPRLMKATTYLWAVNASTLNPEKCIDLLEKVVIGTDSSDACDDLFLYQDAQPRVSPTYEADLAKWTAKKEETAKRLQDQTIDVDLKTTLQDDLKRYEAAVSNTEEHKWLVTPEQLLDYQSAADRLYFPAPNILEKTTDGLDTLQSLYQQFGNQELTATQMVQKLNRIAEMMQREE